MLTNLRTKEEPHWIRPVIPSTVASSRCYWYEAWAAITKENKDKIIRLFKLTRKTWEESTEWREPITMKPLLGILNRSRRKEMLHCKKNKKVLKWTVHQCPKKEKHHINMISSTYIIAGRQELHLVGWRTVAKKNYVKLEEKKNIILNFTLQCPSSSPSSIWLNCHKLYTNLALLSIILEKVSKIWTKKKKKKNKNKSLFEPFVGQLSSYSTLREKLSLLTSFKLFHMGDSLMWHHLSKEVVTNRVAELKISTSQKSPN